MRSREGRQGYEEQPEGDGEERENRGSGHTLFVPWEHWLAVAVADAIHSQCPDFSDELPVAALVAMRQMVVDHALEDECARAIRRFERWEQSVAWVRARMMQALSSGDARKFHWPWVLICLRVAVYRGAPDLVSQFVDEARFEGRKAREDQPPRDRKPAIRKMPEREQGRGAA